MTDNIFGSLCVFCEESLGKINTKDVGLFLNGSVHEFYRLKALISLEQIYTLVVEKKKIRILISKTSMVRRTGRLRVANVHCMQRVL